MMFFFRKENDWIPSKMSQTAFTHLMRIVLEKSESDETLALKLMVTLFFMDSTSKICGWCL